MALWSCWAMPSFSRCKEGREMPRFYDIVRPSSNKAATPGQEKKGKTPAPPKNDGKKDEGGGQ